MVVGLGVDAFEVLRMERALRQGDPGLAPALFTRQEIADCEQCSNPAFEFATRFAVKEAVIKAFALEESRASWRDVEVSLAGTGKAVVRLRGRLGALARDAGVAHVRVSWARAPGLALATAVLES